MDESNTRTKIAEWQTGVFGRRWLAELVEEGRVIDLGGNDYPSYYTAPAEELIPRIINGPPASRATWVSDPHDVLTENWRGKTGINHEAAKACPPEECLLVVVWDES